MRHIEIIDVKKRLQSLNKIQESVCIINPEKYNTINDIKRIVENLATSNKNIQFETYLDLFDKYAELANETCITQMGQYIANEAVLKTRDAKRTLSLIKRRLTLLQNKLKPDLSKKKKKSIKEAYELILDKCIIVENCDRLIENYNNISRRFNLEVLFNENTRKYGVYDTVIKLCNKIETYNIPDEVKYNSIIETALYGFEINGIEYNRSEILEASIDFFLFKTNGLETCKTILESTLFFDKNEDPGSIDVITEEEPEIEGNAGDLVRVYYNGEETLAVAESSNFKEIFEKYKREELPKQDKPENKLKALIARLYTPSVDDVVGGTGSLLKWIRTFFIIGTAAIPFVGPVLAAVEAIADKFIALHYERKEAIRMNDCINKEIKITKDKIKESTDTEEKDRLQKYLKTLEKISEDIYIYISDRFTDEDQEKISFGSDGDDFDFGDDFDIGDDFDSDLDDLLEAAANIDSIATNINTVLDICNENKINETSIYQMMHYIDNDNIILIANMASKHPNLLQKDIVKESVENMISGIRSDRIKIDSKLERYTKLSVLQQAINILNEHNTITEDHSLEYNKIVSESLVDVYTAIGYIQTASNVYTEASFTNTLKLASMKLKSAIQKVDDKEKAICKTIDGNIDLLKTKMDDAVRNDNRESIIKGSIIPSASKIIKMGILHAGIGILAGPVAATISALGYIALSLARKTKERVAVLNELEVELEMCEKYIEIAESKSDMVALKQLLLTKKNLQNQISRLRYNIRTGSNK